MKKEEAIELFNKGKRIRLTCGIWNNPLKDGRFVRSVEEIERFYSWAYKVNECKYDNGIIDLVGASGCDMF